MVRVDTAPGPPAHCQSVGPVGPVALFLGLTGGLVALVMVRDSWVRFRWRVAARRLGMRFLPGSFFEGDRIIGHWGAYPVELDNERRKHTAIVVHVPHLPRNFHCSARTWDRGLVPGELFVGDVRFDRRVRVHGPADEVLARLTASTRALVARVIGAPRRSTTTVIAAGARVSYDSEYHVENAARLEHIVDELTLMADALILDRPVPEQLAANALASDELTAVRLNNLQALIGFHPDAASTPTTCRTLLDDESPWIRLVAATYLRAEPEAVRRLRALVVNPGHPDRLRLAALRTLDRASGVSLPASPARDSAPEGPDERSMTTAVSAAPALTQPSFVEELLPCIVHDPSPAVRSAVAEALADRPNRHPDLLLALAEDPAPEVASTAVRALARAVGEPDPEVAAMLTDGLDKRPYPVRLAAVDALRIVGDLASVEPLLEVLRGSFFDQRLRQATRASIRAIQRRVGDGEAGHLSLVPDGHRHGRLSDPLRGAVSEGPSPTP